MFDNFGSKGPQVRKYLTDENNIPTITDPKEISTFTIECPKSYRKSIKQKKYTALLQRDNKGRRKFHNDKRFGITYQVAHPSDWAEHHLASSINNAILTHLRKRFQYPRKALLVN